ncbi:MAG: Fis family transcriptional regulator [Bacteroidetes bacterium OLB9]|nr:MAG: Fis family transcriptional regulator [Bacteroidetes bacterium OLB9]MCZ2249118.1 MMPL family transporter [Bacteroidia bacterium]
MEKLSRIIIKLKWIIVASVLALTIFFGYQTKFLTINSDILSSLPDDDPVASLYKEIGTQFGGNDMGMIVLETDNVFKAEVLQHIKQITDSLKYTDGVSTVTSLTNILDIKSSEWGIEIGKLVDEYNLPNKQAQLDSLKNYVFSKEMYKGAIVSEDGTATVVMFTLLPDADKQAVAKEIKSKIENLNLPEKLYFGGLPMMMNDISDLILADIVWLLPIVFVIIALILLLSFKSFRGVLLPLLTAGIAVIWTIGIMVVTGYELTIISNIIPVVLLAVGSAYTIHVLNSINQSKEKDRKQALIKALTYIIVPLILAAVTTAIGFVSFVFGAYLTMIKDFGIFTAVGTLIALLLSIFFVPALISAFSMYRKKIETDQAERGNILTHKILQPLVNLLFKHPKYSLTAWGIILGLSISGMFFIKTSVNMADYFKKDNPTRVSEDVMQKKFGGSLPVFVVFEGDMQSPEVLKMMIKTEHFMKEDPNIDMTQSVADLVEQMNDAMGEGKMIPDDKAKIEQLWFLLDGQDVMTQLVSEDLDKGIIQSRFASVDSKNIDEFTSKMNKFIQENNSENIKIELTGMPSVYVKLNDSLIQSQFSSLILALVMVLLIVGLMLRSISKGVYATIPIIATIMILFGFMGITGIPLDIATVLVGSIALGIGIDYSIHIITGFNFHLKETGDAEKAIEKTILSSGKAVIINVISVAAGFLILIFSQIVPLQNFGILVAISMFGSGIGALTLLPIILILANRKRKIVANNH